MRNLRLPTMDFTADLEESLEVIRANAPANGQPYYGLFSGGKDSVALKEVARMAGVTVEWHYKVTTIDPPPLVRFIRRAHPDVKWIRSPRGPFFVLAAEKYDFPTRRYRWCCNVYKEISPPPNRVMLMGIRFQESWERRARWKPVKRHWKDPTTTIVNPILHWDAEDLWDFIHGSGVPSCRLYDEGFDRLGCIGCPMARKQRIRQFKYWPRYEAKWKKVFRRTWERRVGTVQRNGLHWFGGDYFEDWHEMWEWWLHDKPLPEKRTQ